MDRVLIVNGNEDESTLIAEGLLRAGIHSLVVTSALEARVALNKERFRLALVNLELRDLDAFGFIDTAREALGGTPTILTTAFPDTQTVARAASHGFQSVIAKPFQISLLIQRIQSLTSENL
ncbi:MAG: response regulator [Spirochaetia bacterium]|nr:response regulator [Spirochaetia bacterium]